MSHALLDRTIPNSQHTAHLPYIRVPNAPSGPSHVPYDVPHETTESTVKMNRKHFDASNLETPNKMYARALQPTEDGQKLARDLEMFLRLLKARLAHTFVYTTRMISELPSIFSGSRRTRKKGKLAVETEELLSTATLALGAGSTMFREPTR